MRRFLDGNPRARKMIAAIVARAWRDPAYRSRLIERPRLAFAAAGIAIPEEVAVIVTCDSESRLNVLLDADVAPAGPPEPLPDAPDFRAVCVHVDARCREDAAFREAFLAEPEGTLRDLGFALPAGTAVAVHVAGPDRAYFNLPRPRQAYLGPHGPDVIEDADIASALHFAIEPVAEEPPIFAD